MKTLLIPAAVAACLAVVPAPVRAETRACTPITSLPASLTSPGVYCLTGDLTTAMSAGTAISIAADAVTVDCNGYKLGGLAGGPGSEAIGIGTQFSVNSAVVRNCNIRGFGLGVSLTGSGMQVVDNRLDGNLNFGILVVGQYNEVRRNRIFDTAGEGSAYGISVVGSAFVGENTVSGVVSSGTFVANGISVAAGDAAVLSGNRIRGIAGGGDNFVAGIRLSSVQRASVRDNQIAGTGIGPGIHCTSVANPLLASNITAAFSVAVLDCAPVED